MERLGAWTVGDLSYDTMTFYYLLFGMILLLFVAVVANMKPAPTSIQVQEHLQEFVEDPEEELPHSSTCSRRYNLRPRKSSPSIPDECDEDKRNLAKAIKLSLQR